ncbi:DUF6518 family protein [Kineococcus radiotolerans]|uniref:DUF6518 family protein n=1 Tax=Kineococcus radiotolerans TaxID=131568 RepID=UPI00003A3CC8|nr:DUF6518 family protein [Kineococcus radiotolerans]
MRKVPRLLSCLLAGAAFGVLDSLVNHGSFVADPATITAGQQVARFSSYLLNAGWAWAALPVLAGWWATTRLMGAVAGWVSVSAAVVAYYVSDSLVRDEPFSYYTAEMVLWLAACLLLCAPLGLSGAWSRRRDRWGLVAGLVVPLGAAVQMAVLPPGLDGVIVYPQAVWARWTVWVVAAAAAAVSAALLLRRWRRFRVRGAAADVGALW